MIIVSLKYLTLILRAENRGEGGVIPLTALVDQARLSTKGRALFLLLGLFAASLLYGDGMITPAISVLSAVEGLRNITPIFEPYVLPTTAGILLGLFLLQRRGTSGIGALFGPVMVVWFAVLAALGLHSLASEPEVLTAVNPSHGIGFLARNRLAGFLVLGGRLSGRDRGRGSLRRSRSLRPPRLLDNGLCRTIRAFRCADGSSRDVGSVKATSFQEHPWREVPPFLTGTRYM